MPVADAAVAAIARFAAGCRAEELPAWLLAGYRGVAASAVEALSGGAEDPALDAAVRAAGTALGAAEHESAMADAFVLGCRLGASGRSPLGAEGVPLGLLTIAAAVGASRGAPSASEEDLLAAAVAGGEVQLRLGRIAARAGERGRRWRLDQLLTYFGAAVTAARLMGLDAPATESAIGLALTVASGSRQGLETATPLGWLASGLSCSGGVWAAVQAAEGIGARYGALFEPFGLFPLWFGVAEEQGELADLGSEFLSLGEGAVATATGAERAAGGRLVDLVVLRAELSVSGRGRGGG